MRNSTYAMHHIIIKMKISDILLKTEKPELYEKGSSIMWTDEYISKQILNVHLNSEVDLGSRKMTSIEKTSKWILEKAGDKQLNILDLGCGVGLYTEILANNGHRVTGIDFSGVSIEYARKEAQAKNLDVKFINANYLDLDLEDDTYDLVILIYTDLGVLLPEERDRLLIQINRVLKKGGIFIFDVLNDKEIESKIHPKNWEITKNGFWKNRPYLALSHSFLYEEKKIILFQHIILDEQDNMDVYRFWTHFFSHHDLEVILKQHHFLDISFHEDVLPTGDLWNGDNVTFCKAIKQ